MPPIEHKGRISSGHVAALLQVGSLDNSWFELKITGAAACFETVVNGRIFFRLARIALGSLTNAPNGIPLWC
jgi:hypothetical protein